MRVQHLIFSVMRRRMSFFSGQKGAHGAGGCVVCADVSVRVGMGIWRLFGQLSGPVALISYFP